MKPLTLISSIMVIKNFAIEGCASEDAHNARLELATSTYSHLHLKSGSLPFHFKKINYSFYFTCIEKGKRKNKIERCEPLLNLNQFRHIYEKIIQKCI